MIEYRTKVRKVILTTPRFFRRIKDHFVPLDGIWVDPEFLFIGEIVVHIVLPSPLTSPGGLKSEHIFLRESGELWTSMFFSESELNTFLSEGEENDRV